MECKFKKQSHIQRDHKATTKSLTIGTHNLILNPFLSLIPLQRNLIPHFCNLILLNAIDSAPMQYNSSPTQYNSASTQYNSASTQCSSASLQCNFIVSSSRPLSFSHFTPYAVRIPSISTHNSLGKYKLRALSLMIPPSMSFTIPPPTAVAAIANNNIFCRVAFDSMSSALQNSCLQTQSSSDAANS